MRRQYAFSYELVVTLTDPVAADETAIRSLGQRIADFVVGEVAQFPWPVDVHLTSTVDRVVES